jgi:hypothetical protein
LKTRKQIMQASGIVRTGDKRQGVRPAVPLLARFAGKFVLDIMPTALASAIGGFLFTQYHFVRPAVQHTALEQVTPASAEMMAMVRDEHAMIVDYLKTQMVAEKTRQATQTADAGAQTMEIKREDANVAAVPIHRVVVTNPGPKTAASHTKPLPVVAEVPHAPLVIAMAETSANPGGNAAPTDRLARDPDSLLAKTLDLKDHVVNATRHVVGVISDVVFAPFGDSNSDTRPPERQFSSAS